MRRDSKIIIKILCYILMILGASMLLPGIVGIVYAERLAAKVYLATGLVLLLVGFLGARLIPKGDIHLMLMRDGFIVVASAWLLLSLFGAIPFVLIGDIPSYSSAFFETASGFSTTGSTCLTDVEALTKASLFWRSFTHWLGGMGILVMTIALLPKLGIGGQRLMRAETTGLSLDKSTSTFSKSAQYLYNIYIALTIAEIILLKVSGLGFYDACIHTFGSVGTGGFSTYNQSIGAFHNIYAEIIIVVFMLLCGINFANLSLLFTGKVKQAFRDVELKVYLGLILGASVIIALVLFLQNYYSLGDSIRYSVFQVVSIITTTGYTTADYDLWPECCKLIIFLLMFIGGCAGSTGGGMKVIRIVLISKLIRRGARRKLHPNNIFPISIGNHTIQDSLAMDACGYVGLYAFIAMISCLLLSLENVDFVTNFSSVISALSNVGPGFNLVGPTLNFAFYSPAAKILLALLMIAGRLELYTMFVIFEKR